MLENKHKIIITMILIITTFIIPVLALNTSIPIKLELSAEPSTILINETSTGTSTLSIRLLDKNDEEVTTEIDVPVNITSNIGNVPSSIIIPAGNDSAVIEFTSNVSDIAIISVKSKGLISDTINIAVISDTTPPQINLNYHIIEYIKNNILEEGEKIEISYAANDVGSGIEFIELYINNDLIDSQDESGEYMKTTNSLPMGEYTIKVLVVDGALNKAEEKLHVNVLRTGPSVYFGSTETEIEWGYAFIALSAVNPIGNPPMKVQLVLKPTSGVSINETDWIKSGNGVYAGEFDLEPRDNVTNISIEFHVNQSGTHYVDSIINYEVKGKTIIQRDQLVLIEKEYYLHSQPGIEGILAVIVIIFVMILMKRK